jgi:hypothetical protein
LPPVDTIYSSKKEALSALNQWGVSRGYSFTNANRSKPKKAYFGYNRKHLKALEQEMRGKSEGRNKSSQGTNCPFSIACCKVDRGWKMEYRRP